MSEDLDDMDDDGAGENDDQPINDNNDETDDTNQIDNTENSDTDIGDDSELNDDELDDSDDNGEDDDTGGENLDGSKSIKEKEKDKLFSDLSPAQFNIKKSELMQNLMDMYDESILIFERVNRIPKTANNTKVISFILDKIEELKEYLNYNITTTFATKSYEENKNICDRCLVMLKQIQIMLTGLENNNDGKDDKAK